jgi:hypothetical protein
VLLVGGRQGLGCQSLSLAGNDFTDVPIDFSMETSPESRSVLSKRHTEVTGSVSRHPRCVAGIDATVEHLLSGCRESGRREAHLQARPDLQGRYHVEELRAGRYLGNRVDYLETANERSPDSLKEWPEAARASRSATAKSGR